MGSKGFILVIDDELGIREGCRRVLEPQGFAVETATTLQEGHLRIQEHDFDLVLLDVMMPDGRGLDLLEPIREQDPDTVTVIITGFATVELAVEAIKAGAYDFISKPFTPDLLLITVDQGLEKRRLSLETKRLQAIEREAADMVRAKEEAERLYEFKTAFTNKVAHELRAPVAGAISLLRPLMRGLAGELNEQQRDILSRIETRLDILMELVNDLLTLATTQTVVAEEPLESISLQPVIKQVVDRLAVEAANKRIRLSFNAPPREIIVQATEKGLDCLMSNLIGNAIKYTVDGGDVAVTITDQAGATKITVSDSGIGIPAEDLPHIWDEFFRAKNARRSGLQGTGLGLSIVKGIVDHFGGSIEVRSAEGKGSTFVVSLPLDEEKT